MKESRDLSGIRKAAAYFVLAIFIILPFLPHSSKFKYEYGKGKIWAQEDLYAPFDIPIYKTTSEIKEEEKQIIDESIPYYNHDLQVGKHEIARMINYFTIDSTDSLTQQTIIEPIINAMQFVYAKGIVDELRRLDDQGPLKLIAVVTDNVSVTYPADDIFTQTTAFDYVKKMSGGMSLQGLNLHHYIHPNLKYDAHLTNSVLKNQLETILPTKGLIQEGDKIVVNNELITPAIYQKLASFETEYRQNVGFTGSFILLILGQFIFTTLCLGAMFALLLIFRPEILLNIKDLVFTLSLIVLFIIIALVCLQNNPQLVYLIPFTVVPIYISGFFFSRPAIFIHFFLILFIANFVPRSFEFVLLNILAGVTAVIGFKYTSKRGQLFRTTSLIFLSYSLAYFSLKLIQDGGINGVNWHYFLLFAINCLLIIVLFQLTFVFESLLGFVSNARLIELTDTNQKLLRELAEVAPGTFQHVMQVANLAEAVIREIGGDALLVRAGALYHDIGKMKQPSFFVENQLRGVNPHSQLSPQESARIIIEHVTYGIELAKKHQLPKAIVDFIATHHGNSRVYYFYAQYIESHPEDEGAVNKFSYPGPCPWNKELAVVMMADACEAASRSLPNYNDKSIENLIDKVIGYQVDEGYLDQADITLKDIKTAKEVIKQKLLNVYHGRIAYPER